MTRIEPPSRMARPSGCVAWIALFGALTLLAPTSTIAGMRVVGNVVSVDQAKRELTITDAGRQRVVILAPDAQIRHGSNDRKLSDLHRGDRVILTLEGDEAGPAHLVSLAGSPAAPARQAPNRKRTSLSFLGGTPQFPSAVSGEPAPGAASLPAAPGAGATP